jgi:tetratricopeptide (TPR) repeat protein
MVRRASAREREGFADEGKKLRADARISLERARTEGERAVAVAPGLAAAHAALGHVLAVSANLLPLEDREKRDLRARAIERMGRALALDPGDPRILEGRAFLLQDAGRGVDAQADFDAAAAAAPADPAVLAARARNLEGLSLHQRAADAWKEAAAAAPRDPGILVDLGSAMARLGRWKDALAQYRRADALYAEAGGERWKARRGLVTALAQLGLDSKDPRSLAEALEILTAYRAEGGPDAAWAGKMAEVLGEEAVVPEAGAGNSK